MDNKESTPVANPAESTNTASETPTAAPSEQQTTEPKIDEQNLDPMLAATLERSTEQLNNPSAAPQFTSVQVIDDQPVAVPTTTEKPPKKPREPILTLANFNFLVTLSIGITGVFSPTIAAFIIAHETSGIGFIFMPFLLLIGVMLGMGFLRRGRKLPSRLLVADIVGMVLGLALGWGFFSALSSWRPGSDWLIHYSSFGSLGFLIILSFTIHLILRQYFSKNILPTLEIAPKEKIITDKQCEDQLEAQQASEKLKSGTDKATSLKIIGEILTAQQLLMPALYNTFVIVGTSIVIPMIFIGITIATMLPPIAIVPLACAVYLTIYIIRDYKLRQKYAKIATAPFEKEILVITIAAIYALFSLILLIISFIL